MALRQQASQRQAHLRLLAQQHLIDRLQHSFQFGAHESFL
jgi:hypothetical protein